MKLLQQWCDVVMLMDALVQQRCRVKNELQSAKLSGWKSSQDSIAVVQCTSMRATMSCIKDSCNRDCRMLRSCRSEAKQLFASATLVMCMDMVKPLSIHTPGLE